MQNNLTIELMQWPVHKLGGSFIDNKKNIPWLRKGRARQKCKPYVVPPSLPPPPPSRA